jgi:DNA-binding CsgD family transcriptional regulator
VSTSAALERGRTAAAARRWQEALEALEDADAGSALALDDLETLALAAYLTGREEKSTTLWARAHHDALGAGDPRRAARHAFLIGSGLIFRGETAPAVGWFARGGRVLEGCDDCAEHHWFRTLNGLVRMFGGDPIGAQPTFHDCADAALRFGDEDLAAMARLGEGMCSVMAGDTAGGLTLLDEAMVGVTAGLVSPVYSGMTYCTVIGVCADGFDLRRAREWTAALERWCDSQPDLVPFRGNCLVHRCELLQLQGEWSEATVAATQACEYLSGAITWDTLGAAYYQLGELQRLRGESGPAEDSYRRASRAGRSPEPGLALLRLAEGEVGVAAAMIRRALDETEEPAPRARLLAAYTEIMIAVGDLEAAEAAADELGAMAGRVDAPYLHALAGTARGAASLARGDARSALRVLRVAGSTWRELGVPHEAARVGVLVGLACLGMEDRETADLELEGARVVFAELGARPDLERLDALAANPGYGRVHPLLTAREIEVLRLVATGRTNHAIARELGLADKTVSRHLSNIFRKIDVSSRAAATAYAYEQGLS